MSKPVADDDLLARSGRPLSRTWPREGVDFSYGSLEPNDITPRPNPFQGLVRGTPDQATLTRRDHGFQAPTDDLGSIQIQSTHATVKIPINNRKPSRAAQAFNNKISVAIFSVVFLFGAIRTFISLYDFIMNDPVNGHSATSTLDKVFINLGACLLAAFGSRSAFNVISQAQNYLQKQATNSTQKHISVTVTNITRPQKNDGLAIVAARGCDLVMMAVGGALGASISGNSIGTVGGIAAGYVSSHLIKYPLTRPFAKFSIAALLAGIGAAGFAMAGNEGMTLALCDWVSPTDPISCAREHSLLELNLGSPAVNYLLYYGIGYLSIGGSQWITLGEKASALLNKMESWFNRKLLGGGQEDYPHGPELLAYERIATAYYRQAPEILSKLLKNLEEVSSDKLSTALTELTSMIESVTTSVSNRTRRAFEHSRHYRAQDLNKVIARYLRRNLKIELLSQLSRFANMLNDESNPTILEQGQKAILHTLSQLAKNTRLDERGRQRSDEDRLKMMSTLYQNTMLTLATSHALSEAAKTNPEVIGEPIRNEIYKDMLGEPSKFKQTVEDRGIIVKPFNPISWQTIQPYQPSTAWNIGLMFPGILCLLSNMLFGADEAEKLGIHHPQLKIWFASASVLILFIMNLVMPLRTISQIGTAVKSSSLPIHKVEIEKALRETKIETLEEKAWEAANPQNMFQTSIDCFKKIPSFLFKTVPGRIIFELANSTVASCAAIGLGWFKLDGAVPDAIFIPTATIFVISTVIIQILSKVGPGLEKAGIPEFSPAKPFGLFLPGIQDLQALLLELRSRATPAQKRTFARLIKKADQVIVSTEPAQAILQLLTTIKHMQDTVKPLQSGSKVAPSQPMRLFVSERVGGAASKDKPEQAHTGGAGAGAGAGAGLTAEGEWTSDESEGEGEGEWERERKNAGLRKG